MKTGPENSPERSPRGIECDRLYHGLDEIESALERLTEQEVSDEKKEEFQDLLEEFVEVGIKLKKKIRELGF